MNIHTLITHESPDLDAIMSVLLMRRFGEESFPGVEQADLLFVPAGKLPEGKSPKELETEGILALDIGGGRFDTHPVGSKVHQNKRDRSATDLVAEHLGVIYNEYWVPLVEYTRLQDTQGHSLHSKDYIHHLVSVHTILLGLDILYKGDSAGKMENGMMVLENIPVYVENRQKNFNFQELLLWCIDRYMLETPPNPDIPPEAYNNFNRWYEKLMYKPKEAFAKNDMDDLVSLKAISIGAFYRFAKDREKVYEVLRICLDAILKREEQWSLALKEFKEHSVTKKVDKATITHISSENGMVIKAARYKGKGDLIIYRETTTGATSILRRQRGPLSGFPMKELAAKVRIAECVESAEEVNFEILEDEGTHHGWFLHQSGNLLIKGSPKASDFIPSKVPLELLSKIACYQVSDSYTFPLKYAEKYMEYQRYQLQMRFRS